MPTKQYSFTIFQHFSYWYVKQNTFNTLWHDKLNCPSCRPNILILFHVEFNETIALRSKAEVYIALCTHNFGCSFAPRNPASSLFLWHNWPVGGFVQADILVGDGSRWPLLPLLFLILLCDSTGSASFFPLFLKFAQTLCHLWFEGIKGHVVTSCHPALCAILSVE